MYNANAYSAASATSPLASDTIARRAPTEHDVQIEILFCGICHSDLHSVRNEWNSVMPAFYPIVPGHEIKEDALRLGADEVVVSRNADEMQQHAGSFDFILDTVSANHDINAYLNLLSLDGNITLVGAPEKPLEAAAFSLIMGRRSLSGSNIGGIAETQEMLDFCSEHNITADFEVIPIQKVNEAYERLLKSDVKYRFVIDMASLKSE